MCGICGIVHRDPSQSVARDALTGMVRLLGHRGPDDSGTYVRGDQPDGTRSDGAPANAGLGMARLSIIDVEGGHQPMPNEDGSVWVVCNGEIYNFRELRDDLAAGGHRFRTRCDAEVVPHLYEEHGEGFVERLRGMFAIALWDDREGRLLVVRDRLGQKPLVYHDDGERLVFASELQALVEAPGVPRALCPQALDLYLTYQYVPAPLTIYEGIRKLPPGHLLSLTAEQTRLERYWDLPLRPEPRRDAGPEGLLTDVRELMTEAVRMRLISDVPLGAFLSGGIDSSIVVGLMAQACGEPVRTFSIGFGERRYDELDYARVAAERFGTDHREFRVEPDAVALLPRLVRHYGEPFADSSAIPTWYLSERTREHVTVALSGDGGDEAFGGYQRYLAMRAGGWYDELPELARSALEGLSEAVAPWIPASAQPKTVGRRVRRFLEGLPRPMAERYAHWIAYFRPEDKAGLYTEEFRARLPERPATGYLADQFATVPDLDPVAATSRVDAVTYLPNDILTKVDIASMANSLEVRAPFLDHEVMGLAFSLTTADKLGLSGLSLKGLLREAFADLLPDAIRRRGKMGFGVPIAHWFRGRLRSSLTDTLLSPESLGRGYFREDALRHLVAEHLDGAADHASRLWALLVFELWHQEFLS